MAGSKDSRRKGKTPDSKRCSPKSPKSPKSENKMFENAGNKENATPTKVLEPIKEEKSDSDSKRSALAALNAEIPPVSLEEGLKTTSVKEESIAEPKGETPLQVEESSSQSPVEEATKQEPRSHISSDAEDSATTEQQHSEIVEEEATNERRDQTTDAFGELVEVSGSSFGNFFVKFSKDLTLPRSIMLPSVMQTNGENKLQHRYYQYRAKKVAEYCIHPVSYKNRLEKRICAWCAEGFPGQDFNIPKKLLEEDVPDYVLEMLLTDEDMEKEIKNKTNQLYQQHVLVNGFMAKLFGQSLGKSKKFCTHTGKEELGKLHKLAKAYTLVVDVIHSLVTDNSLERWWQAFGALQEDDEPPHGEASFEEKPVDDEVDVKDPLSESKDCVEQSNANDEEILVNRKEFDSMKFKLGEKVFEKKGILSKNAEPSNFSVKFSDRSEKCPGAMI